MSDATRQPTRPTGAVPAARRADVPQASSSGSAPARGEKGWLTPALVYGGAALLGAAMLQQKRARQAEEAHPPAGRLIDADGVALHYVDIGSGPVIVLIHGIGTTLEDWFISGLLDDLLPDHRVILIDRPGSGYSGRPSGRVTPERQARAIAVLMHRLGAHDAVVVGHSFGALVALALGLQNPSFVHSLVLIGGVYYPGASLPAAGEMMPGVPLLGPLLRATISPAVARAALPKLLPSFFDPQPVPREFWLRFPLGLVTRPSALKAGADDLAEIDPATRRFGQHYGRLVRPVTVIAGSGDMIFDPDRQSRRFAAEVPGARLVIVPAGGHMVHHSASSRVAAAILSTEAEVIESDDPGRAPLWADDFIAPPEARPEAAPDIDIVPDPDAGMVEPPVGPTVARAADDDGAVATAMAAAAYAVADEVATASAPAPAAPRDDAVAPSGSVTLGTGPLDETDDGSTGFLAIGDRADAEIDRVMSNQRSAADDAHGAETLSLSGDAGLADGHDGTAADPEQHAGPELLDEAGILGRSGERGDGSDTGRGVARSKGSRRDRGDEAVTAARHTAGGGRSRTQKTAMPVASSAGRPDGDNDGSVTAPVNGKDGADGGARRSSRRSRSGRKQGGDPSDEKDRPNKN